ncbi:hypothetical protein BVRB_4g092720 [Beta vulgaris subsp. vulgaris]|uniref:blue copper protein n=1 Tax=Beta vulgaris subsp. vulgaris TaxID=3555 RepID=UPI00053FB222|nr:blue copper protein [Beta vulgaris subsp. vulgaris]XP_048498993.1 blue copper protein [Beta vulgaris subsp. vulgaris]KMS98393.1 hypothetical protein BVRB_4g092720 [Beta vulgaris subsp. vulgaris]
MEGMMSSVSTVKAMIVVILMWTILFRCVSAAVNHTVGGSSGWDLSSNLSLWSTSTSFSVNDSLVFNYTPDHDVFEVSKSDFETCRINSPISTHDYDDEKGQTVILLSQPGWRYFVCGRSNHCTQGLKLSIQVLNQPNNTSSDDIEDEPEDHEPIPATGGGSNGSGIQGDIPKHGPHSSDGYSNFNAVTTGRCLLHLSIFMMGIMCIFCFPECWRLQMAGV